MNEITTVHIGRQPFKVSVDAYKELEDYLNAIKRQVSAQKDVVEEVELRMAELLRERGIGEDRVIVSEDVDFLKQQLGKPGDFKDEAEARETYETSDETETPRRLYRDTEHALIGGVAAGLAAYFHIDVVIVRILFLIALFSGGWGLLVYLCMFVIVPEAKTPSERLQMHGKPVTVDSIKEVIDRADVKGAATRAGNTASRAVNIALKVFAILVGIVLAAAGGAVLLAELTLETYLLVHGVQVNSELAFPVGGQEIFLLACVCTVLAVFGLLVLLAGTALLRRKWSLPGWATIVLVSLFFASAGVGAATAADIAPQLSERIDRIKQTTTSEDCKENIFSHCSYRTPWMRDDTEPSDNL